MPDQFGTPLAWARYCRPVPPRKSISLECLSNLLRIARPGKHQTQKDASLLWTQIVPGDDRHVAKIAARRDSSARSSTALDYDDTACLHTLQCLGLQWSGESRGETSHHDSGCPCRSRCLDQSAIGARIRVNDVDARQGQLFHRSKLGIGCVAPQGRPIKSNGISIHMPDGAKVERAKRLKAIRRSFDRIPRRMDFVIENNQHTHAARIQVSSDAQCTHEIHPRVRTQCAQRPLRANQDCGLSDVQCQVQKISGLLERSRTMRDYKSLNFRILFRTLVKECPEFAAFLETDRTAADASERNRNGIRNQSRLGKTLKDVFNREF